MSLEEVYKKFIIPRVTTIEIRLKNKCMERGFHHSQQKVVLDFNRIILV